VKPAAALLLLLLLLACAPLNPVLERPTDPGHGYRFASRASAPDADGTFLIVIFSGGGTRAAAFAYGALQALRETEVGGRTLLDDVDLMSSVSGGSFASAYYALYGRERFFEKFPADVLNRNLELGILARVVAPWNLFRLMSPRFSRSDVAAAYYDSAIFGGRRYAEMSRERPFAMLNATDLTLGVPFSFTQDHFDRLCSDLDQLTVGRAVTASSAFPVAFPPLTFANYPKQRCGYREPDWVRLGSDDIDVAPVRWAVARSWREYDDAARRPYLHLSDGGISDNIGLRDFTNALADASPLDLFPRVNLGAIRRLAVIVVDAKPRAEPVRDQSPRAAGFLSVLESAATVPMENYSWDTVQLARRLFDQWDADARNFDGFRARCDARPSEPERERCRVEMQVTDDDRPPHPELFLIHVRFDAIRDDVVRTRLESLPTRLTLPERDVDALIEWAGRLLQESPEYRRLVEAVRQAGSPPD
jgi:NTE family protein